MEGQIKISNKRLVRLVSEILVIIAGAVVVFLLAGNHDLVEKIFEYLALHEDREMDEMIVVGFYLLVSIIVLAIRWLVLLIRSESSVKNLYNELIIEQTKVKYLHGVIPICASCKKIRDDKGAWQELEEYIHNNSEASFTHGICRECITKLYPGVDIDDD